MKNTLVFVSDPDQASDFKYASNYNEMELLDWGQGIDNVNMDSIDSIRFFDPFLKQSNLPRGCAEHLTGKSITLPSQLVSSLFSFSDVVNIRGLYIENGEAGRISFPALEFLSLSTLVLDASLHCDFSKASFPDLLLLDTPLRNLKGVGNILSILSLETLFVSKISKVSLLEKLFEELGSLRDLTIKSSSIETLPNISTLSRLTRLSLIDLPNIYSIEDCLNGLERELELEILYCKKLDRELINLKKNPNIVLV